MNKRLDEIEKQSYTEVMHERGGTYMAFDKEKFAELIVRDCVEQIIIRERADGEWYQDDIFKHFGVEE